MLTAEQSSHLDSRQPISTATANDLLSLRDFLQDLAGREKDAPALDAPVGLLEEWPLQVLESVPKHRGKEALTTTYKVVPISQVDGARTYRLELHIDQAFGTLVQDIERMTKLMLERITAGRSARFIATAKQAGLTWRRNKLFVFPHPLPYTSPPPATNDGIFAEEAAVIAAAFHFPLSLAAPGIKLIIDAFSEPSSGNGYWTLGQASVNSYNDDRFLQIELNTLAFPHFGDDIWAGTIAHEIMHNLGWEHPKGGYDKSKAIVNYDWCIRGTQAAEGLTSEVDDHKLIR